MYAYDNGIKNKNVGFAKTECRGEAVKLWINLKGAYSQEENYRVHFFVRREGNIVGIYMGDVSVKSGMGQFFVAKPLYDIGIPFDDICGLYIDSEPGARMFASQWDDLPFDVRKVVSMEKFRLIHSSDVKENETGNIYDSGTASLDASGSDTSYNVDNEYNKEKTRTEDNSAGGEDKHNDSQNVAAATAETPVWEKPIRMMYVSDGKEEAKDDSVLHASEEEARPEKPSKLDMLFDGKEPVLAFSEDDIYDCVDIGLDELAKIEPKDNSLINNSFVNHGYFNFHHLLLGKKDGNILVVGVPGVYNRREKVTANMFGFEKFKFSMRSDVCMNHFGYWYKEYQYQ